MLLAHIGHTQAARGQGRRQSGTKEMVNPVYCTYVSYICSDRAGVRADPLVRAGRAVWLGVLLPLEPLRVQSDGPVSAQPQQRVFEGFKRAMKKTRDLRRVGENRPEQRTEGRHGGGPWDCLTGGIFSGFGGRGAT